MRSIKKAIGRRVQMLGQLIMRVGCCICNSGARLCDDDIHMSVAASVAGLPANRIRYMDLLRSQSKRTLYTYLYQNTEDRIHRTDKSINRDRALPTVSPERKKHRHVH